MAKNNYEKTHCSKCGEMVEIDRQEVCGKCGESVNVNYFNIIIELVIRQ